jgi:hypothetical protein
MITFHEHHYILGIWVALHDERLPIRERTDWLGTVFREEGCPDWQFVCRVARHASEDLSRSAPLDDKVWSKGRFPATMPERAIITTMDRLVVEMARQTQGPADRVLIQGDVEKALTQLLAKPWSQVRAETASSGASCHKIQCKAATQSPAHGIRTETPQP